MPTVFYERGFRFFFYSNEGSPREAVHIHAGKNNLEAKFWLRPVVRAAYNDGYDARLGAIIVDRYGKSRPDRDGME
jgi:hypothetical protein